MPRLQSPLRISPYQQLQDKLSDAPVFKYRFGCRFADGSTFHSILSADEPHPTVPGRNAFYECLQKDKDGNPVPNPRDPDGLCPCRLDIAEFWVEGPGQRVSVTLIGKDAGKFKVDGVRFLHPDLIDVPPGGTPMLVWFRRRKAHMTAAANVNVWKAGQGIKIQESTIEYHIGWRCYVDGHEHKQTLVLTT